MKKLSLLIIFVIVIIGVFIFTRAPKGPSGPISTEFTNEQRVNIIGYAGHAMEPFISRDGAYLFWNSLNSGDDTSLFYAKRIDDLNFQFIGEVNGVNGEPPHLDAVASMDPENNFYWVSTRGYPGVIENYHQGKFNNGVVTNVSRVMGDFYINEPGWVVMDAEVSPDGKLLFFANAKFSGSALPKESDIGVANKVGNNFVKDQNSEVLLKNINTKNFLEYAPSLSADGKELFFTRAENGTHTFIYLSSRDSLSEPFGESELININGDFPEAPSITLNGENLYYHKKDGQYYWIYKMDRAK